MRHVAAVIATAALAGCGAREELAPSMSVAGPAVTGLVIECDGRTTNVLTPTAVAGPEGLTVIVRNTTGAQLGVTGNEEGGSGAGFGARPGETRGIFPFRPGPLEIACFDERSDDPSEIPRVTVRVQVEQDAWKNDRLRCATGGRSALNVDFAAGAEGNPEPARAARKVFAGDLREGDRVERVGYLGRPRDRAYALVRENRNVGLATMHRPQDGWLVNLVERCDHRGRR